MNKHITKLGLVSSALILAAIGSTTVFALPSQATVHAQGSASVSGSANASASSSGSGSSKLPTQAVSGKANGSAHMTAGKLRACQNRQNAITNIMTRIDTRAQNQITLFSTIATRVETFYTKQGKTLSNYSQLVAAVNTTQAQATSDFATVKTNSTFSCSSSNPMGMVMSFQGYLKTEISDLKNFKTAVKNLIVGVASANGVSVSASSQSTGQGSKQ